MLTPAKGDFGSGVTGTIENPGVGFIGAGPNPSAQGNIPYNVTGAKVAMAWDPAKDEAEGNTCKAYGAPGIMRLPTHLHITWQDENTLKIEADYGTQTRLLHFGPPVTQGRLDYSNATLFPAAAGEGGTARRHRTKLAGLLDCPVDNHGRRRKLRPRRQAGEWRQVA